MTAARRCPGCGHKAHPKETCMEWDDGSCMQHDRSYEQASLAKVGEAAIAYVRCEPLDDVGSMLAYGTMQTLVKAHLAAWPNKP